MTPGELRNGAAAALGLMQLLRQGTVDGRVKHGRDRQVDESGASVTTAIDNNKQ
jgi:hypothetical protein